MMNLLSPVVIYDVNGRNGKAGDDAAPTVALAGESKPIAGSTLLLPSQH